MFVCCPRWAGHSGTVGVAHNVDAGSNMSTETLHAGKRSVQISHADKVFYPDSGITKGELAEYYHHVAPTMVRHTRGRPLAAERYPDGIEGQRVFQKNVPEHFPEWIPRVQIPKKEHGTTVHTVCDDAATLLYLADQACITPHVWLSRQDQLDYPDRLVFDLDPPGDDLDLLRSATRAIANSLHELGLVPFLLATGSRGFHVVVPLRRTHPFEDVRAFAYELALTHVERDPDRLTVEQRKDNRGNRIFLDYLRNSYAQTTVAPYAVRSTPGASVATPLSWDELDTRVPWQFSMDEVVDRLRRDGDPWSNINSHARSLRDPLRRLRQVSADR